MSNDYNNLEKFASYIKVAVYIYVNCDLLKIKCMYLESLHINSIKVVDYRLLEKWTSNF